MSTVHEAHSKLSSQITPHANNHRQSNLNTLQIVASQLTNQVDSNPIATRQLYTPAHFTLSKNPHLHMDANRPEAFSPNTIRMTDSLDKLLRDDDEDDQIIGGEGNKLALQTRGEVRICFVILRGTSILWFYVFLL